MAEAFATSVASNLVSKLGECLFAPIGRQFGYVLCYKSYVQDLEKGVKNLDTARERVQHSIDEAIYNGKSIHTDIKDWLKSVDNKAEEARNLLIHGESARSACLCGQLPNPVVRHPIGRKLKKMTQVIQGLLDERANSIFQNVYYENTPMGIVTATTSYAGIVDEEEDVLVSRASIIEDVMKAIADDKLFVIGVYGPGGVGKSKLLKDIESRVRKEQLFDVVVMANVSRNPDLKVIQGEIAEKLGLKLMNVETTHGRANLLCERLKCDLNPERNNLENSEKNHLENSEFEKKFPKKKILIILDNLWKKLELKDVGIPCGYDNKVRGCKLSITSRHRDVLRNDMCSDQVFRLNELEHGEARRLFERTVGDRVNDPKLSNLVIGVVENCGGLPLLIVSMAKG